MAAFYDGSSANANVEQMLKRVFIFLEDEQWDSADAYCEKVLDLDAENAQAYLGKMMAQFHLRYPEQIKDLATPADDNIYFRRALQFADDEFLKTLRSYKTAQDRRYEERLERAYELNKIRKNLPAYQCENFLYLRDYQEALAILPDSTVVSMVKNYDKDVSTLRNVIKVRECINHLAALKADGTITVIAPDYCFDEKKAQEWTDITAMDSAYRLIVGLRSDGTVVACGNNEDGQCEVSQWRDIVAISCEDTHTVGLRADGTVVACGKNDFGQCDVGDWRGVIQVFAEFESTYGLKADGTVLYAGEDINNIVETLAGWRDIVAISADCADIIGLKADGTVVAWGESEEPYQVDKWKDIVYVKCTTDFVLGLKANGTVLIAGEEAEYYDDVESWTDIVGICCSNKVIVGIKRDGTLVCCGLTRGMDMSNVKLFTDIENIQQERLAATETLRVREEQQERQRLERLREEKMQRERMANWRCQNLCQHCGGNFKGLFKKVCSVCSKEKDY